MMTHTYPDKYTPGKHWASDAAWEILDSLTPGALSNEARAYIAGQIAGRLMRERADTVKRMRNATFRDFANFLIEN